MVYSPAFWKEEQRLERLYDDPEVPNLPSPVAQIINLWQSLTPREKQVVRRHINV